MTTKQAADGTAAMTSWEAMTGAAAVANERERESGTARLGSKQIDIQPAIADRLFVGASHARGRGIV